MNQQAKVVDLRPTIVPKSDQLNADDLIGQSLTIKVTKVALTGDADQPFAIHYEGDNGKPFKPCKSMRRVMVAVWGSDGHAFIGRRMTLYRDDKVQFGGEAVGGIRISHMSDIDRDMTMALTATRAKRKPYTVRPLPNEAGATNAVDVTAVLTKGREAAAQGSAALTAWWTALSKPEKVAAKSTLDGELKATATHADQAALTDDTGPDFDAETGEIAETADGPETTETLTSDAPGPATAPSDDDFPGDRQDPAFDPLEWAAEQNRKLEAFGSVKEIDEYTSDPETFRCFTILQKHSPAIAKQLDAASRGRRKALADKERVG